MNEDLPVEKKGTKRVSVLTDEQLAANLDNPNQVKMKLMGKETKKSFLLVVVILLFYAVKNDSSVYYLSVPNFLALEYSVGTIYKGAPRKIGSRLVLVENGKRTTFGCSITVKRNVSCLTNEEFKKYYRKSGKVWWYRASINGISYENRLLQLEVDGELIISYEEQKNKYYIEKEGYRYISTMFFLLSMFWIILMYISNDYDIQDGKNHE